MRQTSLQEEVIENSTAQEKLIVLTFTGDKGEYSIRQFREISGQNLPDSMILEKFQETSTLMKLFCQLDCFWNSNLPNSSSKNCLTYKIVSNACYVPNFVLKSYYLANFAEICDTKSSFIPIGALFFLDIVDVRTRFLCGPIMMLGSHMKDPSQYDLQRVGLKSQPLVSGRCSGLEFRGIHADKRNWA